MTPQEHFEHGELDEAVAAALAEVKKHPTVVSARIFLCELLCFTGDLERADRQLEAIGGQDEKSMMGVEVYRRLIRAEQSRQQFFGAGRLPEFLSPPSEMLKNHLEASILIREGKTAEAAAMLARAEEARPKLSGSCDGTPFDDFRDLDDLTAPILETLTSDGRYFWIPLESVESVEFDPPARPLDLVWRKARLIVRDGPDGVVFLPALYAGSYKDSGPLVRLGRLTEWKGGDGDVVRGVGQRMFLIGEATVSALEIKTLSFVPPAGSEP